MAAAIVACNKETAIQTADRSAEKTGGIKITATLAPKEDATKAIAESGSTLKTTWAKDEKLAILYVHDGNKMAEAIITSVDGDGKATISFTVEDGTTDDTDCTIVYPATAAKADNTGVKDAKNYLPAQDGALSADLDVRVGAGTIQIETPGLTVTTEPTPQYAIFKFTTKNAAGSANISVSRLSVFIEGNEYVITPASAASTLYVALPPVETSSMVGFTATGSDNKIYSFAKSVTFAKGLYYQSTLKMAEVAGVLPGTFSVSATKKVRFSQGNLRAKIASYSKSVGVATASEWKFAESQYSRIGNTAGNNSFAVDSWVDLFSWVGASANTDTYGLITFTNTTQANHGNKANEALKTDWGENMGTGWRTMTKNEWVYVFDTRTNGSTIGSDANIRFAKATVNSRAGIILFPDDKSITLPDGLSFTSSAYNNKKNNYTALCSNITTDQWTSLEGQGCVFLPTGGVRSDRQVSYSLSYGYYWFSTTSSYNSANCLCFYDSVVRNDSYSRSNGCSIRLVQNQ